MYTDVFPLYICPVCGCGTRHPAEDGCSETPEGWECPDCEAVLVHEREYYGKKEVE